MQSVSFVRNDDPGRCPSPNDRNTHIGSARDPGESLWIVTLCTLSNQNADILDPRGTSSIPFCMLVMTHQAGYKNWDRNAYSDLNQILK